MNWLARTFASALARRAAYAVVAAVLSFVGCNVAKAENYHGRDQGDALSMCEASAAKMAQWGASCSHNPANTFYGCTISNYSCDYYAHYIADPRPSPPVYGNHYYAAPCSSRGSRYAGFQLADSKTYCAQGCEYKAAPEPKAKFSSRTELTNEVQFQIGEWKPTGQTCPSTSDRLPPVKDEFCNIVEGGHQICTKPNGDNCVVSGKTGRRYCPSAPGAPMNATNPSRTENASSTGPAASPGTAAIPPAPRPGENWEPGTKATTTNSTNNTTNNLTINNNSGTPNAGGGATPGDGSANPGYPGTNGPEPGETGGKGEESGAAGAGVGRLFDKQPKTPSEALAGYFDAVRNVPIFDAVEGFFGSCAYAGTCPVWSYDGGQMMGVLTFDALCTAELSELLTYAGFVILSMAAFGALKIAIY